MSFFKSRTGHPPANKRVSGALSSKAGDRPSSVDWNKFLLLVIAFGFLAAWAFLWSRFYLLQVVQGPRFAASVQRQHQAAEVISGRRGNIFDRNGNVLATSVDSFSVSARPSEIADLNSTSAFLANVLHLPEGKVKSSLAGKKGFVWVARKISDNAANTIAEAKLNGIYLQKEYERVYPYMHLAGQVIGFVGMDNKGLDGLEAAFDERLSGREWRRLVQRDARGGRLYMDGRQEADYLAGQDLRLSIDVHIQYIAENAIAGAVQEYEGNWGGCVVIDVTSGDILALAQYPFFNPNAYSKSSDFVRRNKLAMDALEHGSTVKPFVVASAMQEKKVTRASKFDCENGKWILRGQTIRDTRAHKILDVEQILRYSSNIGAAKIGLSLGAQRYDTYLRKLGFGQKTGLPLVGENPGILRHPSKWAEIDLAASAFGQSFSASTLQMAAAYLCIANQGVRKPLQIVTDQELRSPTEGERVFSTDITAELLKMLHSVVHAEDGGGSGARIPGLEAGGKTGTAQKASEGAYGHKRTASFAGLIPAEKPKYVILAIVDEPRKSQYGSVVAAPVFKTVALKTLAHEGMLPDVAGGAGGMAQLQVDLASYTQRMAYEDASAKSGLRTEGWANPVMLGQALREEEFKPASGTVPNVIGMNMRQAVEVFAGNGVMPAIVGQGGVVVRQTPVPGAPWPRSIQAGCVLWLEDKKS